MNIETFSAAHWTQIIRYNIDYQWRKYDVTKRIRFYCRERGVNCIFKESKYTKKKAIIDQMVWLKFRKPVLRVRRTKFEFIIKNVFSGVMKKTNKLILYIPGFGPCLKKEAKRNTLHVIRQWFPKKRSLLTRSLESRIKIL